MATETTEIVFRANAVDVLFDRATGMGSLTDLWRAKGSPANQQPAQWLRLQQARDLVAGLARQGITGDAALRTREGVRGGTWAHWQLAVAYAHYLDADFYLAWNEWASAHITGATARHTSLDAVAAQLRELNATLVEIRAQHTPQQARSLPAPLHPDAVAILRIVRESSVAISPAHVARLLATEGIDRDPRYVRVRLSRLVARGQLIHAGHGLYAPLELRDE